VAVVAAQRPAIRAAASAGAVIDTGSTRGVPVRAAALAGFLLDRPAVASAYGRRAAALVDGLGALRVTDRLLALAMSAAGEGGSRAA
jgi:hypothetical protein